jgi:hypothetical protein
MAELNAIAFSHGRGPAAERQDRWADSRTALPKASMPDNALAFLAGPPLANKPRSWHCFVWSLWPGRILLVRNRWTRSWRHVRWRRARRGCRHGPGTRRTWSRSRFPRRGCRLCDAGAERTTASRNDRVVERAGASCFARHRIPSDFDVPNGPGERIHHPASRSERRDPSLMAGEASMSRALSCAAVTRATTGKVGPSEGARSHAGYQAECRPPQ